MLRINRIAYKTYGIPNAAALPIIQKWILRSLLSLGGYKRWIDKNGLNNDEIAHAIELGCLTEHPAPDKLSEIIVVALKPGSVSWRTRCRIFPFHPNLPKISTVCKHW